MTSNCPSWSYNQNDQSPCIVVQSVVNSCNYTYGSVSPLSSDASFVPTGSNVTQCTCSWVTYNLLSTCMLCSSQSPPSFVSWSNWTFNCGALTSSTYLPSGITLLPNTSIPYYATYNASQYPNGTFNKDIASANAAEGKPDVSGGPVPSSTSSSSSTTPVGAIVGGVIGGVILLFFICGFFLFFFCRRRKEAARLHKMNLTTENGSHFTVEATKAVTLAPLAPSGYPQTSAPMSTSPYAPHSNGVASVPSASSLRSLLIASPTSPGHAMPIPPLPPSVPMSPINDAADVITPFLSQSSSRPANTSHNEKSARVDPEFTPDRATSLQPQPQRSRMNPPPYTPSSPPSSHVRSGSSASRRISFSRHLKQGGGSGDTTMNSVTGNQKKPHARRMRTEGSAGSSRSVATTASVSDGTGAGRSFITALERITTSAGSSSRGPAV